MTGSAYFPSAPALTVIAALAAREELSLDDVQVWLGLPRRTFYRLICRERWRWDLADSVAVALGRHPCELWPDWFEGSGDYVNVSRSSFADDRVPPRPPE